MIGSTKESYDAQVEETEEGYILLLNPSKREVLDHLHFTRWLNENGFLERDFQIESIRESLPKFYGEYMYTFLSGSAEFYSAELDKASLKSFLSAIVSRVINGKIEFPSSNYQLSNEQIVQKDINLLIGRLSINGPDRVLEDLKFRYLGDDNALLFAVKRLTVQLIRLQELIWDEDIDSDNFDKVEV